MDAAAGDWDAMIVLPIILVSMLTVFVFAGFVTVMTVPYGVPPLGLPFTVVSLIWLLSVSDSIRLPTNAVPEVRRRSHPPRSRQRMA